MARNPLQIIVQTCETFSQCVQTQISHFIDENCHFQQSQSEKQGPFFAAFLPSWKKAVFGSAAAPVAVDSLNRQSLQSKEGPSDQFSFKEDRHARVLTKEEVGRATWTLLHSIAAQFPDDPTKQQKRDVKELMSILSRIYPCKECADHFKEVLKANPVQAGSQAELAQWMCHVHNVVNRSLGKVIFPCQRVDARWGKLECKDRACDLQGTSTDFSK